MKILLAFVVAQLLVGATSPELDLLERVAQLDSPALLVLFIVLLARGRLFWKREVDSLKESETAWRDVAMLRTNEKERNVSVAEAALEAAKRGPRAR